MSEKKIGDDLIRSDELHRLVFENKIEELKEMLEKKTHDIDHVDLHGNTPLILAAMLGHHELVNLLIDADASFNIKNYSGFNVLQECISYGHRPTIVHVWTQMREKAKRLIRQREETVMKSIAGIGDFVLTIKWKFSSWIPFVSRLLPNDVCTIYKKGTKVRLDTSLVGFEGLSWQRGDLSFLFLRNDDGTKGAYAVDREQKCWARLDHKDEKKRKKEKRDQEVNQFMGHPIQSMTTPGTWTFKPVKEGIFNKKHKKVDIGKYSAVMYKVKNVQVAFKRRMEHLSEEDMRRVKRYKALMKNQSKWQEEIERSEREWQEEQKKLQAEAEAKAAEQGDNDDGGLSLDAWLNDDDENNDDENNDDEDNQDNAGTSDAQTPSKPKKPRRRRIPRLPFHPSLDPPPRTRVHIEEYFNPLPPTANVPTSGSAFYAPRSEHLSSSSSFDYPHPHLGREMDLEEDSKEATITVAMSQEFPLELETVLQILSLAAPHHPMVSRLKDFVDRRLPPGFPVRLEMPVFPTVTARVTFQNYVAEEVDAELFEIPSHFKHDEERFESFMKEK